jgi:hypothetical protein
MPHHRSPRAASFVPRVETLEDRRLLAATVTAAADGTLMIHGGAENDRVRIFDNGTAAVDNVVVDVNGRMMSPEVTVTHIIVKTGSGNDTVTYNLNGPLVASTSRNLFVDLGPGVNSFGARLRGGLLARSGLSMNVRGGTNLSNIGVKATGNFQIATGATLNLILAGGSAGPDIINADYLGQLIGRINLFAEGGAGNDLINSQITVTPGSTGNVSAQLFGELGNDTLTLNARKQDLGDRVTFGGILNGGEGINTGAGSSGVTFQHIRHKTHL